MQYKKTFNKLVDEHSFKYYIKNIILQSHNIYTHIKFIKYV